MVIEIAVKVDEHETKQLVDTDANEITPDYALSLVIYPSDSGLTYTSTVNYEEKLISADQLPIYDANDGLRINHVFGYMNMVMCSVKMGEEYWAAKETNDKDRATAYIKSIVNKLFPYEAPDVGFMWCVVPWKELGSAIPEGAAIHKILTGASGGANFGG